MECIQYRKLINSSIHKAYLFLSLVILKIISDRSVGILLRKCAGLTGESWFDYRQK